MVLKKVNFRISLQNRVPLALKCFVQGIQVRFALPTFAWNRKLILGESLECLSHRTRRRGS